MGKDVLRVLREDVQRLAEVQAAVREEVPFVRAAVRWAVRWQG